MLQAYVHVTSNYVAWRGGIFGIGALILLAMWVIFIVRILAGPAMTPAARLAAAIEVLGAIETERRPAPTRSRAGGWRIASPVPAIAPPSPVSSMTRCAGAPPARS